MLASRQMPANKNCCSTKRTPPDRTPLLYLSHSGRSMQTCLSHIQQGRLPPLGLPIPIAHPIARTPSVSKHLPAASRQLAPSRADLAAHKLPVRDRRRAPCHRQGTTEDRYRPRRRSAACPAEEGRRPKRVRVRALLPPHSTTPPPSRPAPATASRW